MKVSKFTVNPFSENTYILWDDLTREALVIDPGMCNDSERDKFDTFIADNQLIVTRIILTHLHIDHLLGANYLSEKYSLAISGNPEDNFLAARVAAQADMFGLPYDGGNIVITQPLNEGDTIKLGTETLQILSVPGHSPGSIVIYAPKSNILIAGDVLFNQSIGRTDLPKGDYDQLINAIKTKLLTLPDDTVVCPGHGPTTTIEDERSLNPYLR